MDFITALCGFADFGLLFCFGEYIAINYTIPRNDSESYECIMLMNAIALVGAIAGLTFAICELSQPGITYSQLGFAITMIVGLLLAMIPALVVDRYNNHLMSPSSKDLP